MVTAELTYPSSARDLLVRDRDADALVVALSRDLPPGGVAATRLRGRFHLTDSTWRLLDARILAAAGEILDLDVARPLVHWLATFERVRHAAEKTVADPGHPEATEVLLPPRPLSISDHLTVAVRVDGAEVADVRFALDVQLALGETSVVVREGAVADVVCDLCTVSGSLSLDGWAPPLWKPEPVKVPVRLVVRPPIAVPLRPVPAPRAAGLP